MYTKVYWIHTFENSAKLGIMPRPRGGDWLDEEVANFKKQKIRLIVSLLEKEEIFELGLGKEESICQKHGIEFINFPIKDRDIPKSGEKTEMFINQLKTKVKEGASIAIHCRMGIGRSSIIGAAVILTKGLKADEIIDEISVVRGLKVPDTDDQLKWLKSRQPSRNA